MTQTVLYYPTISIPNTTWLRQAIFYFDKVASIAPQVLWDPNKYRSFVALTPELDYLWHEGIYEPMAPDHLIREVGRIIPENRNDEIGPTMAERQDWPTAHRLKDEFKAKIEAENFEAGPNANFVRVHGGKLNRVLLGFLEDKGLLKADTDEAIVQAGWFLVEERTALLYMSMLAQALADIYPESMVPGTDRPEYERLVYNADSQENSFLCFETQLCSVLPVPRQDVPFSEILDFKRRREPELLQYRTKIDDLQKTLKQAETPTEVKEALRQFEEAQSSALRNLTAALNDARVATVWGSIKTLIKVDSPALWGTVAVTSGLTSIATLPISLLVAGTILAGTVEVGSYLIDERNKERATIRESPFAYLYYAQQEGV